MVIAICGLGLIGGSMARAYKKAGHTVLGADINENVMRYALQNNIIDGELCDSMIKECDILFIALCPQAARNYLAEKACMIGSKCTVIDLCGTKREICELGFELAKKHGFTFCGGHPMAGTHFSGIEYSRENMFFGASMVIVPPDINDEEFIGRVGKLLEPAGFGKLTPTTANEHDRMIAYTSQLAHVVSNAYVKSPTARNHHGFSAGSYKDLTRVAKLNEHMWTELFLENGDHLLNEIDAVINALTEYRNAIKEKDAETLCTLLREGRIIKEETDGI